MAKSDFVKKKLIILLTVFVLFISSEDVLAQIDSANFSRRTMILLQLNGPEVIGVHLNVSLNNRISVNAGLGIGPSFHLGSNFYFSNKSDRASSRVYAGIQIYSIREICIIGNCPKDRQPGIYIPFGFENINKKGFTFQIDIGPNFVKDDWNGQPNALRILWSIKIGMITQKMEFTDPHN